MRYFTNHCWCSKSNWGGVFDCRYILTIEQDVDPEFDELLAVAKFFSDEEYQMLVRTCPDYSSKEMSIRNTLRLQQPVIDWLTANVADRKSEDINKGWAIGTDEYNRGDYSSGTFSIFFHRRRDLMNFIKEFSKYKKPTFYFDYFRDKRKTLNLETLRYEVD